MIEGLDAKWSLIDVCCPSGDRFMMKQDLIQSISFIGVSLKVK